MTRYMQDKFNTLSVNAKFLVDDSPYFVIHYISEKIRLDISCESSAGQTIRMKCQTLVSLNILKNKEYFNMSSAAGATIFPRK